MIFDPPPAYSRGDVTYAQVAGDIHKSVEVSPDFNDALAAFRDFLVSQEEARLTKDQLRLLRSQAVSVLEECAKFKSEGGDLSTILPIVTEIFTGVSQEIAQGPRWDQVVTNPAIMGRLESTIGDAVNRLEDQLRQMAKGEDAESTIYKNELEKARENDRRKIEELETVIRGLQSVNQSPSDVVQNSIEENLKIIGDPSSHVGQKQIDARKALALITEITGKSLPPKTMLDRTFVTIGNQAISQGSSYDVFLGEYFTGEKIAIKVLRHRVDEETATKTHMRFARLTENWAALRHDCILPFYGVGVMQSPVSSTEYQLYLVSPYLKNQDIKRYIKKYPAVSGRTRLQMTLDIARGLEYMHEGDDIPELGGKGVVHSALNIYNVLVKDSGRAVISGLGHSKVIKDFQASFTGDNSDYRYMGPEILDDAALTFGSDIWSWAMTSLEILTDEPPFGARTRGTKIIQLIGTNKRPQRENHPEIEHYKHRDEIWQLFEDCWKKHPNDRPSAREIVQRLNSIVWELNRRRKNSAFQQQQPRKKTDPIACGKNALLETSKVGEGNEMGGRFQAVGELGPSTKVSLVEYLPTGPPNQKDHSSPLTTYQVSSRMSISEVITLISLRGLPNITSEVDRQRCSDNPFAGGGFGDVFQGYLRNGLKVAIKCPRIFDGSSREGRNTWAMAKEAYTWSKHKHPNVLESCGIAEFRGRMALISPWVENGTVMDYIAQHPDVDRPKLCTQVACGLSYLHAMGTVHGDIKGANVLIGQNGIARLTDFGSTILKHYSIAFSGDQVNGLSTRWAAPEHLIGGLGSRYADVYSLGMTILQIMTSKLPFEHLLDVQIPTAILVRQEVPSRPENHLPTMSRDGDIMWKLLESCWQHIPGNSPTAHDIEKILSSVTPEGLRIQVGNNYLSRSSD